MNTNSILQAITIVCFLGSASTHADEFTFVEPLFKDMTSAGGQEITITPLLIWTDTDADSYPDKLKLAFNSWAAGTNTQLLQTSKKTVTTPTLPCTSPTWHDSDIRIKFMGQTDSYASHPSPNTVYMIVELEANCGEAGGGEKSAYKTVLYAGDVVTTGASSVVTWKDWEVAGTSDLIDWDGDGTRELQLVLTRETLAADASKLRVIYMQHGVGGSVEADHLYSMESFNY